MEILLSCDYSLLWTSHPFIWLSIYTLADNPARLIAISLLVYAFVYQQDYRTWFPVVESLAQWPKKYFPIECCRCPAPKGKREEFRNTAWNWTGHGTVLGQGFCCWDRPSRGGEEHEQQLVWVRLFPATFKWWRAKDLGWKLTWSSDSGVVQWSLR